MNSFFRGYRDRLRLVFPSEQDALVAVSQWEYCDYAKWGDGWFGRRTFSEMAFDGKNFEVYNQTRLVRNTAVGVYGIRWKQPGWMCAGTYLGFEFMDIQLVLRSLKVEYLRRLSDWLQKGTNMEMLDLPFRGLRKPLNGYYLVRYAKEFDQELDM